MAVARAKMTFKGTFLNWFRTDASEPLLYVMYRVKIVGRILRNKFIRMKWHVI